MDGPNAFADAGILTLDPLITYSKRHTSRTPIGLAGGCPELFAGRTSLHIVGACWLLYDSDIADIAAHVRRLATILPQSHFVFLSTTDHDVYRLAAAGVPTILANASIFANGQVLRPLPPFDGSGMAYDAICNARFEPYKRHELARLVDNLALIYDNRFDGSESPTEKEIRALLPTARYLNHEFGGGQYKRLDKETIARENNRARCGLCLSRIEGYMTASIEYLLCGTPVVTTQSVGGRDRYFASPFAITVPDDPQAIADAVTEMGRRQLNKLAIRDHIGRIVEFERRNFLSVLNTVIGDLFGRRAQLASVQPFTNTYPFAEPDQDWFRARLQRVAAALGVTLPPVVAAADA
jgi:glycosyltransferase involved in cell wall biosynthesis